MRHLSWLAAPVLAAAVAAAGGTRGAGIEIRGLDGRSLRPFEPATAANVIIFLTTDCPISNGYAPEIQRICREYGSRGVTCSLMYEDVDSGAPEALAQRVRDHLREYRYEGVAAAVDGARQIARHARASVTPQAVVVDRGGEIRYRGRIDNFYAALGKPRQQITERDLREALDAVLDHRAVAKPETTALGCHIVDPAVLRKK